MEEQKWEWTVQRVIAYDTDYDLASFTILPEGVTAEEMIASSPTWQKAMESIRVSSHSVPVLAVDSVERLGRYKLAFRNEAYIYRREGAKGIAYYIAKRGRDFLWVLTRAKDHRLKRLGVLLCGVGKGLMFYPKQERI